MIERREDIDLFWQHEGKNWGVEIKYADAPRSTRAIQAVLDDLELAHLWIVYPGRESYPLGDRVSVMSLTDINGSWIY